MMCIYIYTLYIYTYIYVCVNMCAYTMIIYCGPDWSGSQGSPVRFPTFRTVVPARMPSNLGENFHPEKWESKPMDCGSFNGI